MTRLSAVIGKPVIDISSTRIAGVVCDVYFDNNLKSAVYFCIEPSDGRSKEKLFLPFENASAVADAIIISDETKFCNPVDLENLQSDLIGKSVYYTSGVCKGKISDASIFANAKVGKFKTETDEFTPSSVISSGDVILIKSATKSKSKKTVIPRPKTDYPVYILNDAQKALAAEREILKGNAVPFSPSPLPIDEAEDKTQNNQSVKNSEPVFSNGAFNVLLDGSQAYSYDEDSHTPTRVICDYEFLLGRTLGADLCTYTGEIIATKGSAVTDFVVEKARRAGKLVELTLNSVKPSKQNSAR